MKRTAACVFVVSLLFATPALAGNIVLNAGFENGGAYWATDPTSPWFLGYPGLLGLAHTGTGSASASAPEEFLSSTYIMQSLNTAAGDTYDLSFWVATTAATRTEFLIKWDGNTVANFVNPTNGACSFNSTSSVYDCDWLQVVVSNLTASSNFTTLGVFATQQTGLVLVDDFMVDNAAATAVPEPTSIMLMGSGLMALAARYRKRKAL